MTAIPFNQLKPVHDLLADELKEAADRVLNSGWFILGPEVQAFEQAFAKYFGLDHAIGVANGTDAIEIALRAAGIGPGDEVITTAHTAVATITAIERTGATPVMVDIEEATYTLDPQAAAAAINTRTKAIVPVHIYGQPADLDAFTALCDRHGLLLMEDCAQSHGARWKGQLCSTFGPIASFSFYPTKNLGALGDGGAVATRDAALAERARLLRNYGQTQRYHHDLKGMNSRLDEMQAALLAVKLKHLDDHNQRRREIAARYSAGLRGVTLPVERPGAYHVYHLYVIRHPRRDELMAALQARGIGTLIHYPLPNHLQPAYAELGYKPGSLPITEKIAGEIVSLPLYIGLTDEQVDQVIAAVNDCAEALA